MSVVYRAVHRPSQTPAAIKVITRDKARERRYRQTFHREVLALARLHHPHIARIYDLGEVSSESAAADQLGLEAHSPWFAMELAPGTPLVDWPASRGWEPLKEVLAALLDALAHAHARNVGHHDLQPRNILLDWRAPEDFDLKLVDFGITQLYGAEDDHSFEEEAPPVIGTPNYMAPEQILNLQRQHGPWTDLYALGCLAWRLITGEPPFGDDEIEPILQGHIHCEPPRFEPRFRVPDPLEAWLRRLLKKSPQMRFRRAADALYALLRMPEAADASLPQKAFMGKRPAGLEQMTTLQLLEESLAEQQSDVSLDMSSVIEDAEGGDQLVAETPVAPAPTRAPLPKTWRQAEGVRDATVHLNEAELQLYELREVPLVDRIDERDRLWELLRRVHLDESVHGCLLQGAAGCGKTALGRWLAHRGHELGVVTVLRALHSPLSGHREGLRGMLAHHLRCHGLSGDELFEHLERIYTALGFDEATLRGDVSGMVAFLSRDEEATEAFASFGSPTARRLAIVRLLRAMAQRRPLLLWLDDVHWSRETLEFIQLLTSDECNDLPVMLVATLRDDLSDQQPQLASLRERLVARPNLETLELGPLDDEAHRRLIERYLKLSPELTAHLVEHTAGNPLHALQQINDWVERDVLRWKDSGFVVDAEGDQPLTGDIFELWEQRLGSIFEAFEPRLRKEARRALQVAAALGHRVDQREWRRACSLADIVAPDTLVERLCERGLVRRTDHYWSFEHALLHRTLCHQAKQNETWRLYHWSCAQALQDLYPIRQRGVALRVSEHLVESARFEEALETLLVADEQAHLAGEYAVCEKCLEKREALLDRLGEDEESPHRAQNWWRWGRLELARGDKDNMRRSVERSLEVFRRQQWDSEAGQAALILARLFRDNGRPDEALEFLDKAAEHFAASADQYGLAQCRGARGSVLMLKGDISGARKHLQGALDTLAKLDNTAALEARITNVLGMTWFLEGDIESAEPHVQRALKLAQSIGARSTEASCWNNLGEFARHEGDWPRAREHYANAATQHALAGSRHVHIARTNLAFSDLAAKRYAEAEAVLEELIPIFEQAGWRSRTAQLWVGLACCAAARGGASTWERSMQKAREIIDEVGCTSRDLFELAERAADLALEADEHAWASEALRLAADQHQRLDQPERANALLERAERLEASG